MRLAQAACMRRCCDSVVRSPDARADWQSPRSARPAGSPCRLGSEFVPRLSEGAIVIGIVRPPGTSLEESLRMNTRMEKHPAAKRFPTKSSTAGAASARRKCRPTPAPSKSTDLFITLHPREHWTKAKTQAELVC